MSEVLVIGTGVANTASVLTGLRRLGAEPRLTRDPKEVRQARRVVLPGVGHFAAAMDKLRQNGIEDALKARVKDQRPTLAVCLGLQLLCEGSEESPGEAGLGLLPIRARRFPQTVRVPQLGWNLITPEPGCTLLTEGYAYFANSFCITEVPQGWSGATSNHGIRFVAALEKGPLLACQFHPELSSTYGRELLGRWLHQETATC